MQPAKRWPSLPTDVFRIDAKAEGEKIVVGGWESFAQRELSEARWFSVELTRKTAPWAYVKADPFRTISSLELVAVLIAVMLFAPGAEWKGSRAQVTITAVTDNLGNTFVLQKFMSCKYPLSIVVMESGLPTTEVWARDGPSLGTKAAEHSCRRLDECRVLEVRSEEKDQCGLHGVGVHRTRQADGEGRRNGGRDPFGEILERRER